MQLPIAKLTTGLAAVATTVASQCSGNACLQTVTQKLTHVPSISGGISAPISSTTMSLLETVRGGAAASTVIDFSREGLFLQGMATYGAITALILNASLRLFTSTKFSKDQSKIVSNSFNAATALCIISGVFTAILFQLMTIYSKSALGLSHDDGYLAFKSATSAYRIWGFRCFLTEMMAFVASFMLNLYNTLWTSARQRNCESLLSPTEKCIFGGSIILILTGVHLIRCVLKLASQHIFYSV